MKPLVENSSEVRLADIAPRLARARDQYLRALEYQRRAAQHRERQEAAADGYKKCRDTGKRRYRTMQSAEHALVNLLLHIPGQYPCRAYACKFCGGWHLTSQARRPVKQRSNA